MCKYFSCHEHTVSSQHIRGYYRSTANSEEENLTIAVKQYIPLENGDPQPGDVTIIAAHAAGFFKELYAPLFDDIFRKSQSGEHAFRIRAIWIADMVSHGTSSVLNEGRLGIDFTYEDHARDLLHMINVFRKDMPKPIFGLGHSIGACSILQLCLYHPRLFTAVASFEPVINRVSASMNFSAAYGLTERRDVWASKEEAVAANEKSGLVRKWDPRVVALFNRYGFRELPTLLYPEAPKEVAQRSASQGTKAVTFATTKHHDARGFLRGCYPPAGRPLDSFVPSKLTHPDISRQEHVEHQQPVYCPGSVTLFHQIQYLRPACLFIYGGKSTMSGSTAQERAGKLARTGTATGGSGGVETGCVTERVIKTTGHFGPLEQPEKVAEVSCQWFHTHLQQWRADVLSESQTWDRLSTKEKAMVDDDWRWWVREWYARKPKAVHKGDPKVEAKL